MTDSDPFDEEVDIDSDEEKTMEEYDANTDKEIFEHDFDEFDPNVDEDDEFENEFDPNVDEDDEFDNEFDPNVDEADEFTNEFDPNTDDAEFDEFDVFDPNVDEDDEFTNEFDPNVEDDEIVDQIEKNSDQDEQVQDREEDEHENVDGNQSTLQVVFNPEAEEEYSDEIEEITDSELFEALSEGLSPEEIEDLMQKANETYEALREEAELNEQEADQVNHSNEEKPEEHPEEVEDIQDIANKTEKLEEELESQKEKELGSENQDDEEVEADYKEEIRNSTQFQEYIDTITDLANEGKSVDEIQQELEKEDELEKFKEYLEKLCEKEEQETLRQVDNADEEEESDYKDVIENPHAGQEFLDDFNELVEKGKLDDEIEEEFKEQEEIEKLSEEIKKIHENEQQENLRRVDHADEEEVEDYCEVVDNTRAVQDLVDTVDMEKPEQDLVNKSNDKEVLEKFVEFVKDLHKKEEYENRKQVDHSEGEEDDLPPNLSSQKIIEQFIAQFSEEDNGSDIIEEEVEIDETNELVSPQVIREESKNEGEEVETLEDEEFEKLKELYKKDTRKRPIYAGKETKAFSKWLQELVEESQKLVEQFKEKEEQEEAGWQKKIRKWIFDHPELISKELKKILMEIIYDPDLYERLRVFLFEFSKMGENLKKAYLSEKEYEKFIANFNDLIKTSKFHLNLYENLRAFKEFFEEHSVWNPHRISKIKERFLSRLSEKYRMISSETIKNSKICGICKEILPLNEFEKYGSSRGKKKGLQSYRSTCKRCRSNQKSVLENRNKHKIAFKLFNGRCQACGKDLVLFPAFEFHHRDSSIKKNSWRKIRGKTYDFLLETVKNEKMIPLCGNCHLGVQSKYFNKYKNIIIKKDLFELSQVEIENLIDETLENLSSDEKRKVKFQLKRWLRKRYVVETLYGNKCIICDTNVIDNLPVVVFHHIDQFKKKHSWRDLRDLNSEHIIKILIKEKCIAICSNCHTTIRSIFEDNIHKILGDIVPEKKIIEIQNFFKKLDISGKINNFIESDNFDKNYESPLKYDILPTDIWKIKTIKLSEFLRKNEINQFRTRQATIPFNNHYHRTYELIQKLKEENMIKQVHKKDNTQNYFQFTENGNKKVQEFQERFGLKYKEIKENTKIISEEIIDITKRIENDDVFIIYPKLIKKIIERKGFNEFTAKELQKEVNKSFAQISKIIKGKLIPSGYIREILNPKHMQKKGTTKYYQLIL